MVPQLSEPSAQAAQVAAKEAGLGLSRREALFRLSREIQVRRQSERERERGGGELREGALRSAGYV